MPECRWLDDGETLTYLHSCVSTKRQRVRVPETPMYLDALLADRAADRRPRAAARRPASAHAHHRRLPDRDHARDSRRAQSARLSLSLVDARDHARQDRRDEAADQDPPAMVRQAQVDRRDPQGGDDQRGVGADRHRRPQQGDRCRRRAAGTRLRSDRRGLCHRDGHGLGRRIRASPTKSCASSRRSSRAATSPAWSRRSTRSRPGLARCPAMSTPMSASRRSRR